jgi:hypothetical protein
LARKFSKTKLRVQDISRASLASGAVLEVMGLNIVSRETIVYESPLTQGHERRKMFHVNHFPRE